MIKRESTMKVVKHAKLYAVLCWPGGCCLSAFGTDDSVATSSADIVIADFESGTYGNWTVEGKAFGKVPYIGGSRISPATGSVKGLPTANRVKRRTLKVP